MFNMHDREKRKIIKGKVLVYHYYRVEFSIYIPNPKKPKKSSFQSWDLQMFLKANLNCC